jgi:hypothetical protein
VVERLRLREWSFSGSAEVVVAVLLIVALLSTFV